MCQWQCWSTVATWRCMGFNSQNSSSQPENWSPYIIFAEIEKHWSTLLKKNGFIAGTQIFQNIYPCAAVKGIVSLKVWRQHCSLFPPRKRVFSMDKTFESWSLATPRSKSLVVLSLCHNSTSNGNLKCRKKIGNLQETTFWYVFPYLPQWKYESFIFQMPLCMELRWKL